MKHHSILLRFRADPSPASPATGARRVNVMAPCASSACRKAVASYTGPWFARATVVKEESK